MKKFFRCTKCGHQFIASSRMARNFRCGAVIDYVPADDPNVGNNGILDSIGIKPLGCGGKITEVSAEEAMNYVA